MKKAQAVDPRVVALHNVKNLGVGGSISKGYESALKQGVDICVVMDGDGQMPPDYLESLLKPILENEADVTKGNRFYSKSSFNSMPAHRVIGNLVFSLLNKIGSGYWKILDPQNGYVASSARILKRVDFHKLTNGYSFQNAYLCAIKLENAVLKDVPIPAKYGNETSTMPIFKVTLSIFRTLIQYFFIRILSFSLSPITLFLQVSYLSGVALLFFAPVFLVMPFWTVIKVLFLAITIFSVGVLAENIFEKSISYR